MRVCKWSMCTSSIAVAEKEERSRLRPDTKIYELGFREGDCYERRSQVIKISRVSWQKWKIFFSDKPQNRSISIIVLVFLER